MTDDKIAEIRKRSAFANENKSVISPTGFSWTIPGWQAHNDRAFLLAEVERLNKDLATQQGCCDGAASQDAHVRREREEHRAEVEKLRAEIERLRAAATSAGAALAAAIELLERGREDAPSKRMFSQMLADYRVIVARTRKALEGEP